MKEKDNGRLSLPTVSRNEVINYLYSEHKISPVELFDRERVAPFVKHNVINDMFKEFTDSGFTRGSFMTTYQITGTNKSYTVDFPGVTGFKSIKNIETLTEKINMVRNHREQMIARSTYLYYKKQEREKNRAREERTR